MPFLSRHPKMCNRKWEGTWKDFFPYSHFHLQPLELNTATSIEMAKLHAAFLAKNKKNRAVLWVRSENSDKKTSIPTSSCNLSFGVGPHPSLWKVPKKSHEQEASWFINSSGRQYLHHHTATQHLLRNTGEQKASCRCQALTGGSSGLSHPQVSRGGVSSVRLLLLADTTSYLRLQTLCPDRPCFL